MTEETMSSLLLEDLMLLFLPSLSLSFSLSLSLGSCEATGKGKEETREDRMYEARDREGVNKH